MRWREQLLLAVAVDRVDELATVSAAVPWRATSIVSGSLRIEPARRLMSSLNVAENSSVCLRFEQQVEDPADVGHEAHVQHPVRLVEDEDLDLAEVGRALADEVEQPARASRRGSRRRPAAP